MKVIEYRGSAMMAENMSEVEGQWRLDNVGGGTFMEERSF